MFKARIGGLVVLAALLTACNIVAPNGVPPTVVMMVITSTPDPNVVAVTVTPTGNPAPATSDSTIGAVATGQAPTFTAVALQATGTPAPAQPTSTFGPTQTLSPFPTETRATLYIAQQDFVIWVLVNADSTGKSGEWRSYPDTFLDGEPEFDPNLNPPSANLYQPKRGFGKLWRNTAGLKDQLGWGTTPEFALNTTYVYQPGGYLDSNDKYVAQPGKHFVTTLSRQVFALSEGDHRWERVG